MHCWENHAKSTYKVLKSALAIFQNTSTTSFFPSQKDSNTTICPLITRLYLLVKRRIVKTSFPYRSRKSETNDFIYKNSKYIRLKHMICDLSTRSRCREIGDTSFVYMPCIKIYITEMQALSHGLKFATWKIKGNTLITLSPNP